MTKHDKNSVRTAAKEYAPYIVTLLLAIVCAAFLIRRGDFYASKRAIIAGVSLYLVLGMAVLTTMGKRTGWQVEIMFICYYTLFGVVTLVFIPPNSTPDFYYHYLRAYEIAHGHILTAIDPTTATGLLPQNLMLSKPNPELSEIIGASGITLDYSNECAYSYATDAVYSPVTLLPASIGILLAEFFTSNSLALITAARAMTWLVTGLILFISIKNMPIGKSVFAFTAILPMSLELYTSVTTDVIVIALAFALFAYVMHLRHTRNSVSIALLTLLVCLTSLEKIVYLPLCLLVLAVPAECFGSVQRKRVIVAILAVIALVIDVGWLLLVSDYATRPENINEGANSAEQIQYVLAHPISFVSASLDAIMTDGGWWVLQIMGAALNRLDVAPAALLPYLLLIAYMSVCMKSTSGETAINWKVRMLFAFVFFCTALLILASEYIYWSPVASPRVLGVQGRYFTPILPLLIMAFLPGENQKWKPSFMWFAFFAITTLIFLAPLEVAL